MDEQARRRVETIFHAARNRSAGTERKAYVDGACGTDLDLRARVDALLAAHEEADDFLDAPAVAGPEREGPGTSIGPYKLLQEIGEGGMGVVYMAQQETPVSRKVALKVIKLGMDTKQVIARFEAERQALAMMDHPHIARVLDAGATDTGRPYFVMELVRGVSINEYCDTHKLATEERLQLFIEVCRALQHAHQKGVIHRDLKPTNVLVTSHDGKPVPKIIDFGVAKATNQKLTERTLFTEFRQIIGTPEYMSPEQAEMSGLDVDTRSDIYALGVLLYQLLTGTTPVDPTELRTAGYEEMTRIIREDEPPAPSTRVSKLGARADEIAGHRSSDAGSLSRHFRGDLDWIVMKALEKDRTRRYETAAAFADDVLRHLENRPVVAGPPGTAYRLAKFVHRNRKPVVAALVLLVAVALGLAGTTAGFLRARAEADRSSAISDSLQDVLAMTDPRAANARGDIEAVLARVHELFSEDHATYAAVLDTLSVRLHDAGEFESATRLTREALDVWTGVHGAGHPNVGIALARLGALLRLQGEEEEAEGALRDALALLASSEAPALAGFEARSELADLLGARGDYVEADRLLGQQIDLLRASGSPSGKLLLQTMENRFMLQLSGNLEEAIETLKEIYAEASEYYPDDSPIRAVWALALGNHLSQRGQPLEAEPYLREAIGRFRALGKLTGVHVLAAHDALFQIVRGRTDPASVREADDLLRTTIDLAREFWGPEMLRGNLKFLATRMAERGRWSDAIDAIVEMYQALVESGGSDEERRAVRDGLAMVAVSTAIRAGESAETYAKALEAVELALAYDAGNPAYRVAQAAVLYRQDELARTETILDQIAEPLGESEDRLARRLAPVVHAFRALLGGRYGDEESARAELAALRVALQDQDFDGAEQELFAEIEALIEGTTPAVAGD